MVEFGASSTANGRRWWGLAAVILLHALIVWGLVSGLARKAVSVIAQPITMAILSEPPRPEPPKPVPPPERPKPPEPAKTEPKPPTKVVDVPPPRTPPPQTFVPPAEVRTAPSPAPTIQAVQETPPERPVESKPAPPAPAPAAAPVRAEVGLLCPGYKDILENALDGIVDRVGIEGEVRVQITVKGREIVDVKTLSGPREYFRPVQAAVRRFRCIASGSDEPQVATLTVGFRQD